MSTPGLHIEQQHRPFEHSWMVEIRRVALGNSHVLSSTCRNTIGRRDIFRHHDSGHRNEHVQVGVDGEHRAADAQH